MIVVNTVLASEQVRLTEAEIADMFRATLLVNGGCWDYQGGRDKGYGRVRWNGRLQYVHRIALALTLGRPLTGHALHRCDNPACFRPLHLYEGDQADNNADRDSRGRTATRSTGNGRAKLTQAQVDEIRRRYVPGINQWQRGNRAALCEEFGMSTSDVLWLIRTKAVRAELDAARRDR